MMSAVIPLLKMVFVITDNDDVSVVYYYCEPSICNNGCDDDVMVACYCSGHSNDATLMT